MKDCIGKELSVGDQVVCSDMRYADLLIGVIIGFTPKKAKIEYKRSEYQQGDKKQQLKESYQIFKYTEQIWISVKERLPKQNELVLCYNIQRPKREPFIGRYLGGSYSEAVYAFLSVHRGCSVGTTHWQPLPEPPELLKGGVDNG